MNYHWSYVFLQDLLNSFHRWFNFSIHLYSGVSQQFGGVSHCHSQILKTEEEFYLHIISVLSEIRGSSSSPSSHNCLIVRILFIHLEQFRSLFSLFIRSPSSKTYSFSAFSYHSPNLTGASFKYPLVSS